MAADAIPSARDSGGQARVTWKLVLVVAGYGWRSWIGVLHQQTPPKPSVSCSVLFVVAFRGFCTRGEHDKTDACYAVVYLVYNRTV